MKCRYCTVTYTVCWSHTANMSDFLRYHSEFLKVNEIVDYGVIAQMYKCQIFFDEWKKRDLE